MCSPQPQVTSKLESPTNASISQTGAFYPSDGDNGRLVLREGFRSLLLELQHIAEHVSQTQGGYSTAVVSAIIMGAAYGCFIEPYERARRTSWGVPGHNGSVGNLRLELQFSCRRLDKGKGRTVTSAYIDELRAAALRPIGVTSIGGIRVKDAQKSLGKQTSGAGISL